MREYTIYFTDSDWNFTVKICTTSEQEALKCFAECYPQMYIQGIE